MTEADAKEWIEERFGTDKVAALTRFASLLCNENQRQNLIAPSTIDQIWSRHLLDSAQLAQFGQGAGMWLDIGTGGGLPGLVLAMLLDRSFVLTEPRRLRAEFLQRCVASLELEKRVEVKQQRVEVISGVAETISARAVTGLDGVFRAAAHCSHHDTIWVLPRGKSGANEVEAVQHRWPGEFHVERSLTDPDATIVIARGVRPR